VSRGIAKDPASLTVEQIARAAVSDAVRDGRLPPPRTCILCRRTARVYHHGSYEPQHHLHVVALCSSCHGRVHSGELPDPLFGHTWDGTREARELNAQVSWRRILYGDRLRKAREARRLSVRAAAKLVGISHGAWHNVETGHTGTTVETLARMCNAVGLVLSIGGGAA
jgi:DNA-binding XRE family transcriptional regulator